MGSTKMGGHWSTEEGWKVSTMWTSEGLEAKISKVRATCKSHTDDKVAKGECCQTKRELQETQAVNQLMLQRLQRKKS